MQMKMMLISDSVDASVVMVQSYCLGLDVLLDCDWSLMVEYRPDMGHSEDIVTAVVAAVLIVVVIPHINHLDCRHVMVDMAKLVVSVVFWISYYCCFGKGSQDVYSYWLWVVLP